MKDRKPRCPDCSGERFLDGQWRTGVCDDCGGAGGDCANCGGTGSPVCCRCEGTGVDPMPEADTEYWGDDEIGENPYDPPKQLQPAPDVTALLRDCLAALNTAPRFKVPSINKDSYALAAELEKILQRSKE